MHLFQVIKDCFDDFYILIIVGGHDSAEDALTCMDLMKLKVKLDIKKMIQMQKKQNADRIW